MVTLKTNLATYGCPQGGQNRNLPPPGNWD